MTDQECAQHIKALVECQARVTQGYDVELDETTVAEIASIVRVHTEQSDRLQRLEAALKEMRDFSAAVFRVLANPDVTHKAVLDAIIEEARAAGVTDGFGQRAESALSPESPA